MGDCEMLSACGFFTKYQQTSNLACRGFMRTYCQGPEQANCKRREYRRENGCPPNDEMLPTGQMMPKSFGGHG